MIDDIANELEIDETRKKVLIKKEEIQGVLKTLLIDISILQELRPYIEKDCALYKCVTH